jgi:uncharacterized integral membrane protein (TIGR02327 family)
MGVSGLFNVLITVICIWIAWWALQGFRFDIFMRNPGGPQAKVLLIMISIILGYLVSSFIIDYLQWSLLLKELF